MAGGGGGLQRQVALETALAVVTANQPGRWGFASKGDHCGGQDADLLLIDPDTFANRAGDDVGRTSVVCARQ